jgi:acetyl-CoA synthetase
VSACKEAIVARSITPVETLTIQKRRSPSNLAKRSLPREIIFVGDILKTRNAKVMRRIVRAAYLGEKLGNTSALENPASLDQIKRAAASSH